ncbi:hypothetical protein PsYK624_060920 [Phanerochaete sordida]|uniref:BTB domain-containing protein n=1 Tax=Phanerochaete sordida TaxID=48140 RepID=A0A9P3G9R4_9APHY|nr:hypothetical protein PsYK624_060920 [Phanerochaete sordida]
MQQVAPVAPMPVWEMRPLQPLGQISDQDPDATLPLALCSIAFAHDANMLPSPPDLVLVSSDGVHFYIQSPVLLSASTNMFNALVFERKQTDTHIISVPEASAVINVLLHAAYLMSCAPYQPGARVLLDALDAFPSYGLSFGEHLAPSTPFYDAVQLALPDAPMDFYLIAAEHDLAPFARAAARHLDEFEVTQISEAQMQRMGVLYYNRLIAMLGRRASAVKQLLRSPPDGHPYSALCAEEDQQVLRDAWVLTASQFTTDLFKNTSSEVIVAQIRLLRSSLVCTDCRDAVTDRLQSLQAQLHELDQ